ncbi:MAG TPA: type 1 glutamine amidotransferase domain-containing protein [Anaerolineae bacterium]|nr:type 1 glutamine amidotransferase domain-containing protein [Anaerolineae bacterium]HOQ98083.1 type 1 glutamine amidotransferase domain-containing protein [Anaerolineae bacterium]HPL29720.1 type 1 glutamine amidotransferase domain-containing protein [Anaerolineae bacterium]
MSEKRLDGITVAALVADGFEQVELTEPMQALRQAGAEVRIVAPKSGTVRGWDHNRWGDEFRVDVPLAEARAEDFDAILQPGGVMSPDTLRMDPDAVNFFRDFRVQRKPIAALCHGPWMIVQAGLAEGLTLTSWPSLKTDIRNAGGHWVNEPVVESNGIVTSRKPADIPAFNQQMILQFSRVRRGEKVGEQVPLC